MEMDDLKHIDKVDKDVLTAFVYDLIYSWSEMTNNGEDKDIVFQAFEDLLKQYEEDTE